jgi:cytochrome c oxidase subunit 3
MALATSTPHSPDIVHGSEHVHVGTHGPSYAQSLRINRLGLWLFFFSEAFLFGGLLAVRFFLWGGTRPQVDQVVGLIVTLVLLLSSFSMYYAETSMENGNRRMTMSLLLVTALLGALFLFGVMVFEWGLFPSIYEGHLTPWGDKYGAVVFLMTGMHALHVITGIAFILIVWNLLRKGNFSPQRHWGVESCASYWHYVDLVWIFFYPAIYLIGTAVHH